MKRIENRSHLVIASYDGISTYYCGIGTTMQDTISSLEKITDDENLKISLAYINADPTGTVYNHDRHQRAKALVKKTGGNLIPLCNGTKGQTAYDMWQSFPQWNYLNASLATALNLILLKDERNVLMLHDTPYLLFHKFKQQIFDIKLECFYMPRSSASNHRFGEDAWRTERLELEKEAFRAIASDENSRVLAIGQNFGRHLEAHYDVTFGENDFLVNGLDFERYGGFRNETVKISDLKRFGIDLPESCQIIFAWGRASIAKGMKELIEAWRVLELDFPDHYLIVQSPNNSGENDYFQDLRKLEMSCERVIVIDNFNPEIWQSVLRTKNTSVVSVPSVMDPIPHTAIEAKLFAFGMRYVIVGSNVDGVIDVLDDDECLWTDPYDHVDFVRVLRSAILLSETDRTTKIDRMQGSLVKSDYVKTMRSFLFSIGLI